MPKKSKAIAPPRKIVKEHFFRHPAQQQFEEIKRIEEGVDANDNQHTGFPPREKRRFFVYDKETGEPFAEWINNVAVSLETGEELFRSRRSMEEEDGACYERRFDFSVPTFYRADDPTIYTADLVMMGVITEQDLASGSASLTKEKHAEWKQRISEVHQAAMP